MEPILNPKTLQITRLEYLKMTRYLGSHSDHTILPKVALLISAKRSNYFTLNLTYCLRSAFIFSAVMSAGCPPH